MSALTLREGAASPGLVTRCRVGPGRRGADCQATLWSVLPEVRGWLRFRQISHLEEKVSLVLREESVTEGPLERTPILVIKLLLSQNFGSPLLLRHSLLFDINRVWSQKPQVRRGQGTEETVRAACARRCPPVPRGSVSAVECPSGPARTPQRGGAQPGPQRRRVPAPARKPGVFPTASAVRSDIRPETTSYYCNKVSEVITVGIQLY